MLKYNVSTVAQKKTQFRFLQKKKKRFVINKLV